MNRALLSLPNGLSLLRLALAPLCLAAALAGSRPLFLILFATALASDALDGYCARRLGQVTELGGRLDSWGDCVLFTTTPIALWWLWPEVVRRETLWIAVAAAAFALPILLGAVRYRALTSYHTRGAKLAAVLLAGATPLLLLGGPAWPLHLAVAVLVLAEIEEVAITLTLPERRDNVASWAAARRLRRALQKQTTKE